MSGSVPYIPNIFKIFEEYGDTAPKSLSEVSILEEKCRKNGKEHLADSLFEWRVALEYHIEAEHIEPGPFKEFVRYEPYGGTYEEI